MMAGLDHSVFFEWATFKMVQGKEREDTKTRVEKNHMRKYSNPEPLLGLKHLKSSYFHDGFREIWL